MNAAADSANLPVFLQTVDKQLGGLRFEVHVPVQCQVRFVSDYKSMV